MAAPLFPVGTAYGYRERADGAVIRIHRVDVRDYRIERHMPDDTWRELFMACESSSAKAEALRDRLAVCDADEWHHRNHHLRSTTKEKPDERSVSR
jgi:hypothetical protein